MKNCAIYILRIVRYKVAVTFIIFFCGGNKKSRVLRKKGRIARYKLTIDVNLELRGKKSELYVYFWKI